MYAYATKPIFLALGIHCHDTAHTGRVGVQPAGKCRQISLTQPDIGDQRVDGQDLELEEAIGAR